ncbi:hypothetical protein ACJQWK_09390 [Exserohilum turcicum]
MLIFQYTLYGLFNIESCNSFRYIHNSILKSPYRRGIRRSHSVMSKRSAPRQNRSQIKLSVSSRETQQSLSTPSTSCMNILQNPSSDRDRRRQRIVLLATSSAGQLRLHQVDIASRQSQSRHAINPLSNTSHRVIAPDYRSAR